VIVRIVEDPIEEAEVIATVDRPEHGASLVFRGVVRDHHEGRAVSHIEYHCYRGMAEKELRAVAEAVAARHGISALAVVHRIGEVRVGEASLLVAASAPHRQPVFDAVLEIVDELKRRVPIWKKEYGPDGSHWVEGVRPEAGPGDAGKFPEAGCR